MANKKMILTGDKESFIVRVLLKKVNDAGVDGSYVPYTVNAINEKWDQDSLVVLYMDKETLPKEDVIHFIADSMEEKGGKAILIGEQADIDLACNLIPEELIYKIFSRPVDNDLFAAAVTEYFEQVDSEEFMKRILIVDDDPQYLSLVRQWLKGTYRVSMVNSGLQAIKFLGKTKVDLILLDYEMPVTSGPQVLEMLRSDSETSSIPVMFLTGKSDKESVMEVVSLRPEGYFLKSIQKEELLEKLNEFFVLHK